MHWCKQLRALVLRFGSSVERQNFAKGISEFSALWLDAFDQATLPIDTVYVLLILAETSGYVPTQTPLAETAKQWHHHARSFIQSEQRGKLMSADNLVETRQRLLKLGAEDAVMLVSQLQYGFEPFQIVSSCFERSWQCTANELSCYFYYS